MPYLIYSIVYFVINFGFFFIINTGIEVKIVRRMHKELAEKRECIANMNSSKSATSLSSDIKTNSEPSTTSHTDEEKKREEEDVKKERKVVKMVVLNSILNFLLRAPEMAFWLENTSAWPIFFKYQEDQSILRVGSYVPGLLSLIADIGYLTFIITFTTNFLIFYKFNKNFKEAVVFF
jgi:hypothetical protein